MRLDPRPWIEANLSIRDKQRRVIPFLLNEPQVDYHSHATQWDVILKARQIGFTTLVCGLYLADTLLRPNTTSVIVAHDIDSAEKIFRIVQLFWEALPDLERTRVGSTRFSNRREFLWPKINSQFYVGTAGALAFGRGQTINNLHCSEFAFWPRPAEALVALTEAVPANGRIVLESTANGVGNYFHDLWRAAIEGENRFTPHWYRWFDTTDYAAAPTAAEEAAWAAQMASAGTGSMAAANGTLGLSGDEVDLIRGHGLSFAQIKWRRDKLRDLGHRFRAEYPENEVDCFLASSRACFDLQVLHQIAARIAAEPPPESVMTLRNTKGDPVSVAPARLLVWKRPQPQTLYVVGADIGEGLPGGDASCGVVLEHRSGEQVAELHGRVSPERFGHLLDALGRWYNRALLAVERNNHGHSTLNTLRNMCHYPRLYYHVRYDARAGAQPILGWPTDQATKPILVDDLAAAIAEGNALIHSPGLVDECMTFVAKPTGQEAEEGAYDDRVMAFGIAWQARRRAVARGSTQRPEGM